MILTSDEKNFVVVPLFSPGKSQGVIIADNFVTGNHISNDDVMAHYEENGFRGVIAKPFEMETLIQTISKVIHKTK